MVRVLCVGDVPGRATWAGAPQREAGGRVGYPLYFAREIEAIDQAMVAMSAQDVVKSPRMKGLGINSTASTFSPPSFA